MDFQTMRANINKFEYQRPRAILEDIRLVFTNCERYNVPTAEEYQAGQRLCCFFVRRVKELHLDTLLGKSQAATSPKANGPNKKQTPPKISPKVNGGSGGSRRSGRRT